MLVTGLLKAWRIWSDDWAGREAEARLATEFPPDRVLFQATDVANEDAVRALVARAKTRFGQIDVVLNNATFAPAGLAVIESPVDAWDRSYAVNLRGPVLLARACLPEMIARRHGVFVCVSSTGGPYLAPLRGSQGGAAQLELTAGWKVDVERLIEQLSAPG